jgi:hypothetical protein
MNIKRILSNLKLGKDNIYSGKIINDKHNDQKRQNIAYDTTKLKVDIKQLKMKLIEV